MLANTSTLDINTNGGKSDFNIANNVAPVNINGEDSGSSYTITGPLSAPINVMGDSTLQTLIINATAGADNLTITPTSITGLGAAITYSGLVSVIINGLGGSDTFTIAGNTAATTINAGIGNSTFNVQSVSSPLTLNTGTGTSTVNLGSPDGVVGDLLSTISADIAITGSGSDTLNINDAADNISEHGTLSSTSISGGGDERRDRHLQRHVADQRRAGFRCRIVHRRVHSRRRPGEYHRRHRLQRFQHRIDQQHRQRQHHRRRRQHRQRRHPRSAVRRHARRRSRAR